uniref:Uncharacterized protein n=1 Tax=Rhizophora mucronata TaxID=61149 RepID=A0A2P2N2M4_RHIMU
MIWWQKWQARNARLKRCVIASSIHEGQHGLQRR